MSGKPDVASATKEKAATFFCSGSRIYASDQVSSFGKLVDEVEVGPQPNPSLNPSPNTNPSHNTKADAHLEAK